MMSRNMYWNIYGGASSFSKAKKQICMHFILEHFRVTANLKRINIVHNYTEISLSWCTRFGEFYYCCCLSLLPQLACSIHAIWSIDFSWALYKFISPLFHAFEPSTYSFLFHLHVRSSLSKVIKVNRHSHCPLICDTCPPYHLLLGVKSSTYGLQESIHPIQSQSLSFLQSIPSSSLLSFQFSKSKYVPVQSTIRDSWK